MEGANVGRVIPLETEVAESGLSLDIGRDEALSSAAAIVREAWRGFDRFRVGQPPVDAKLRELLRQALPEHGTPTAEAIADAAAALDESIAQPRPRYFAFIGSSGLEIGVIADALAACYDVNLAVWAGAASEVEAQAVRWAGELVGFPAEAGSFTSGGTVSNLTALTAAARERALPGSRHHGLAGRRLALYCSAEVHYSVVRAAELLGIGSAGCGRSRSTSERRLRPDAVAHAIDEDRAAGIVPVAVVATAGHDPHRRRRSDRRARRRLRRTRRVAPRRRGLRAAGRARPRPRPPLPRARAGRLGDDRRAQVALPAEGLRDRARPPAATTSQPALGHEGGYMPHDRDELHPVDLTLEYSRPFRALKLWLALRVHGAGAFLAAIERNLEQARLLYRRVSAADGLEPLPHEPQLSVVPFRHVPAGVADLDAHNLELVRRLQAGGEFWVAPAHIDGRVYVRPCLVNFRTSDDDVLAFVDHVERIGREIAAE